MSSGEAVAVDGGTAGHTMTAVGKSQREAHRPTRSLTGVKMKSEGEDGIGLTTCSERRGIMTAWWRCSGNQKGREKWDDLKPHGEERWKKRKTKEKTQYTPSDLIPVVQFLKSSVK